ncbi:MAG TPA: hypothetical protein DCS07_08270 [Bdellovibrionales bacterium]|nr:MAG: hypothetical protein A2Z97_00435 [Bdellovibrionales bacterium GWB1_52_6]OFZ03236.1 MAG: hypothetical protein A2X97_09925 [Bdellovibrionales bacterium GWA1_52_35]OFZ38249.1 MAG: hypothetical protein A2070_05085 [Bdellovibrionales bacterium GWC1_52_8]HAR42610.1 hypothetical protein [Bdellovibrionales bacterium]HCM40582.1 hypothetical protein [Bdellovibrionales bacterium]
MTRTQSHGKLSSKKMVHTPEVYVDKENDFASIRLSPGVEAKSYEKNGFIFSEDAKGHVIEIQILNLSTLAKGLKKTA